MKSFALLAALSLIIFSCKLTPEKPPSLSKKPKHNPVSWEKLIENAKKDRTIYGVFDISKDSVVLLRRSKGIELSKNGGKTWIWLGKQIYYLKDFTVDNHGIWWGLERWKGIHESSYCLIHKSADQGKTWETHKLDALKMLADKIYSEPHEPLQVVNYWDHRVYQLSGNNPVKDWKYIKQLRDDQNDYLDLSVENYGLSRNNKLYVKKANGKTDTLINFTKADLSYMEKVKEKIYVAGTLHDYNGGYLAIIEHEHLLKELVIDDCDMKLTKTVYNHIYITGCKGAYIVRNNNLIHIYK